MSSSSIQTKFAVAAAVIVLPGMLAAQSFKVEKFNIGGEGGTDYLTAEAGTGRVFVSRGTHVMVIDGPTGKVLGDIPDTPRTHGIALDEKSGHGFTTNAGDSTVTMFNLKTLAVIKKIKIPAGGLDGIMFDAADNRVILTNHSRPNGTMTALNPESGDIVSQVELEDNGPEGAVADGKGHIFVANEGKSTVQKIDIDAKSMKTIASYPLAPCEGPTGIAYDKPSDRVIVGCGKTSVVLNGKTGKVVGKITNGDGVDALGYDASQKLIYIPSGDEGNVTVARLEKKDKYTVVATVPTMKGAKTIATDPIKHMVYLFQPEYGPAPANAPAPTAGRGRARGPMTGTWFFAIHQ